MCTSFFSNHPLTCMCMSFPSFFLTYSHLLLISLSAIPLLLPSLLLYISPLLCVPLSFTWSLQAILTPHHRAVIATILSDVEDITHTLTTNISHPPLLPHTPPIASKLLWLHGLGERISGVMDIVRNAAPELLEGEQGWKLRQTYGELTDKLQK